MNFNCGAAVRPLALGTKIGFLVIFCTADNMALVLCGRGGRVVWERDREEEEEEDIEETEIEGEEEVGLVLFGRLRKGLAGLITCLWIGVEGGVVCGRPGVVVVVGDDSTMEDGEGGRGGALADGRNGPACFSRTVADHLFSERSSLAGRAGRFLGGGVRRRLPLKMWLNFVGPLTGSWPFVRRMLDETANGKRSLPKRGERFFRFRFLPCLGATFWTWLSWARFKAWKLRPWGSANRVLRLCSGRLFWGAGTAAEREASSRSVKSAMAL